MLIWGCGHNHNINHFVLAQIIHRWIDLYAGMVFSSIVFGLEAPLHDSMEIQLGHMCDEGDVEDLGTEAITNDPDIELSCRHCYKWVGIEVLSIR